MQDNEYHIFTDEVLIDLLKDDDQRAFEAIYKRYSPQLYVHAYNLIRDREATKDILQFVFTKLWDIRATLSDEIRLSPYLYQSIRNNILNQVARDKVAAKYLQTLEEHYSSHQVENTDYHIREKQLQQIIEQEIQQLPPKMREMFELSRKQFMSHKEIAEKLGVSEKTVKNQISNALQILRSRLKIVILFFILFGG